MERETDTGMTRYLVYVHTGRVLGGILPVPIFVPAGDDSDQRAKTGAILTAVYVAAIHQEREL